MPVLGAAVNICERPHPFEWKPDSQYLPNGTELAKYLAEQSAYYPDIFTQRRDEHGQLVYEPVYDLVRVSQYVEVAKGALPLHLALHEVFAQRYHPSIVHRFLARLAQVVPPERPLLTLTTNYDDALELAFRDAGVAYDVITYVTDYPERKKGHFTHSWWKPGEPAESEPSPIKRPKTSTEILRDRPAVVKIHGAVRRDRDVAADNYVITEDDYIDFMVHQNPANLLPVSVAERLPDSHFLFLGYALRDWNLRVLLRRIWQKQSRRPKSWSVRLGADQTEVQWWDNQDVATLLHDLAEYVVALRWACLERLLSSFAHDEPEERRATLEQTRPAALFERLQRDEDRNALFERLPQDHLRAFVESAAKETSPPETLLDEIRRIIHGL